MATMPGQVRSRDLPRPPAPRGSTVMKLINRKSVARHVRAHDRDTTATLACIAAIYLEEGDHLSWSCQPQPSLSAEHGHAAQVLIVSRTEHAIHCGDWTRCAVPCQRVVSCGRVCGAVGCGAYICRVCPLALWDVQRCSCVLPKCPLPPVPTAYAGILRTVVCAICV